MIHITSCKIVDAETIFAREAYLDVSSHRLSYFGFGRKMPMAFEPAPMSNALTTFDNKTDQVGNQY